MRTGIDSDRGQNPSFQGAADGSLSVSCVCGNGIGFVRWNGSHSRLQALGFVADEASGPATPSVTGEAVWIATASSPSAFQAGFDEAAGNCRTAS